MKVSMFQMGVNMKSVLIEDNNYIFNGEKLREIDINDVIIERLGKKIRVIVLGENILIKVCDNVKGKIKDHVENMIIDNLIIDDDTLIDYKYDRRLKKVYIYSIKQGIKVRKIIKEVEDVKIIPIQYIIRDILNNKAKYKKSYQAVIKYGNFIYLICIENKHIISSVVINSKERDLVELIEANLVKREIIIDLRLKEYVLIDKESREITFLDLKEKINNEISKVQRFFTRNDKSKEGKEN